jgi:hypothetical protein
MFMGVVLPVIALTEFNQSQTVLTSLLQIAVGATLIFSNRTRELMWLFGMLILDEGFGFFAIFSGSMKTGILNYL